MTQPVQGPPDAAGEHWNVNMPAVIGVVFVFLVGVIVWVVLTGDDSDQAAVPADSSTPTTPTTLADVGVVPSTGVPLTTTPAPMPDPSAVAGSTTISSSLPPVTTPPVTTAPVTTAPGAETDAVAGDLAVPGRPMQRPGCDGSFITVIASAIGNQASAAGIANVLDAYPGSNYLRTDQTCPSLTPEKDGQPIYVVYFGPFAFASDACAARAQGTEGAYARQLSNDLGPDHGVSCS